MQQEKSYLVSECPVIVNTCGSHLGGRFVGILDERCNEWGNNPSNSCLDSYQRCGAILGFIAFPSETGKIYLDAGCDEGHLLNEIQRDINLNLDGIPIYI